MTDTNPHPTTPGLDSDSTAAPGPGNRGLANARRGGGSTAAEDPTASATVIDMDAVVEEVKKLGVTAYVEHTGGGCATIYAGPQHTDGRGDRRWAACAGPGWFDGPAFTRARADTAEFFVGPDDDGLTPGQQVPHDATAPSIAATIASVVRAGQAHQERLTRAVTAAHGVVWATIAAAFPEATTAGLDTAAAIQFEHATAQAVAAWLEANLPPPRRP